MQVRHLRGLREAGLSDGDLLQPLGRCSGTIADLCRDAAAADVHPADVNATDAICTGTCAARAGNSAVEDELGGPETYRRELGMQVDIEDITLLSKVRRESAFWIRTARSLFQILAFFGCALMLTIGYAVISDLGRPQNARIVLIGIDALSRRLAQYPDIPTNVLIILVGLVLCFGLTKGNRVGWFIVFGYCLYAVAVETIDLADNIFHGFPEADLSIPFRKRRNLEMEDVTYDIRALPFRLYSILFMAAVLVGSWRIVRIFILPSFRSIRPLCRFVFAQSGNLRSLALPLRHPLRAGPLVLYSFVGFVAYLTYVAILVTALIFPYRLSTPRYQVQVLAIQVDNLGPQGFLTNRQGVGLALWYFPELVVIGFILIGSRMQIWISKGFLVLSKRMEVRNVGQLRALDARRPVLYLRSFRSDVLAAKDRKDRVLGLLDPYRETARLEDLVATRCFLIGPVVALADPRKWLQPTGAARTHAEDANWQQVVANYMSEAALVVVLLDSTENLSWEIDNLKTQQVLERTVFIIPPEKSDELPQRAWTKGAEAAPEPEALDHSQRFVDRMLGHFLDEEVAQAVRKTKGIRAIAFGSERVLIFASSTTTYSDYDLSLRIMLDDWGSWHRAPPERQIAVQEVTATSASTTQHHV